MREKAFGLIPRIESKQRNVLFPEEKRTRRGKRKSKFQSRLLSYHRRLGSRSTILGIRAIPECRSHSTRCPFLL
ncbi:hypothetical protein IMY05_019G0004800 [Salix suchowensis]|nr:hypothetical protein IMY05_019G0004800 [Salix suchowensis]